ncbi:MAG TPA: pitrilysin family protein, partial [Longimicrobiales bacterium]|nr:pitrilysin family protein [Longimicrobiales bacterium]
VEDTPDDLIFELQSQALWNGHPYGHSILGTRDTVSALSAADLRRVHASAYSRPNIVIAAAGHVAHERFVRQVATLFSGAPLGGAAPTVPPVDTRPEADVRQSRDTAQTHLALGIRTFGHPDPRRYASVLLSNAMGGGMSSRLFQRVREELGLAYSVFSFQSFYRHAGVSGVYVGTRPEWADHALEVIREEMARVAASGLDAQELQDAKGQVKGQLALSLESSGGRMHRLAGFELYDEPFQDLDALTARIDAVTGDDIAAIAAECWDPDGHTLVRLGPDGAQ